MLMKSFVSFLLGIALGVGATLGVQKLLELRESPSQKATNSITMFKEPGNEVRYSFLGESITTYKVIQVLPNGAALACPSAAGITIPDHVILFLPLKEGCYYDSQEIVPPKKHVAKQAGIYRYETKDGDVKTVPVVKFYPKK